MPATPARSCRQYDEAVVTAFGTANDPARYCGAPGERLSSATSVRGGVRT